jgi:hypothetical protein
VCGTNCCQCQHRESQQNSIRRFHVLTPVGYSVRFGGRYREFKRRLVIRGRCLRPGVYEGVSTAGATSLRDW